MSSCASTAKQLESHDISAITRPSVQGAPPQPVAFAVRRPSLTIRTPVLGILMLPALLAVTLVGPVIRIGSLFSRCHCAFLARWQACFAQNCWVLARGFGTKRHRQWTQRILQCMASSCAKPSRSQRGFARKNKNHNQSRCGRIYMVEKWVKRRRKTTWSIFGAMPLVSPPYTSFLLNGDIELHRNRQLFVENIL